MDKGGAIFGSCLILATLGVLVGTSTVGIPVWEITVPPACIMLLRDVWCDWSRHRSLRCERHDAPPATSDAGTEVIDGEEQAPSNEVMTVGGKIIDSIELQTPRERRPARGLTAPVANAETRIPTSLAEYGLHHIARLRRTFPTVSSIVSRLPIPLLPFAFLTFILVNALSTKGWVALLARWWGAWVRATGVLGAVGGMGFLSCIFCNVRTPSVPLSSNTNPDRLHRSAGQTSAQRSSSRGSSSSGSTRRTRRSARSTARCMRLRSAPISARSR